MFSFPINAFYELRTLSGSAAQFTHCVEYEPLKLHEKMFVADFGTVFWHLQYMTFFLVFLFLKIVTFGGWIAFSGKKSLLPYSHVLPFYDIRCSSYVFFQESQHRVSKGPPFI